MDAIDHSDGIEPLFAPLRIEYSWEGCFEYDRQKVGHSWHFSDLPSWKRVSLEVKRGNKCIVSRNADSLLLSESAKRYSESLRTEFLENAARLTGKPVSEADWQLVGWLTDSQSSNKSVGRGLSLVLNALVRNSTTKPFEVLSSFVGEHITVEVRALGDQVPCWFYLQAAAFEDLDEYLVCFPELFLVQRDENWMLSNDVLHILRALLHVRCKHHYEVVRIEQSEKRFSFTLRDKAVITEYAKGAICGCIPVPGKCPRKDRRREPEGVNAPEVVVTSPVVARALEQLSRVWQDPYAKSVLISSPPGSGKEVFSSSIPVGNGRPADTVFSLSMASDDQKGLERQLYGFAHPDGSVIDGLIARATDGALFLDEVHQPEKAKISAARASLLRTLEAETYFPQESSKVREVKNVLWVMATSKTLNELKDFKPVDFWTRMTHAQEIPHPLDFPSASPDAMRGVIANFFRIFWWDLCDKQYQIDPTSDPNHLAINVIPAYWQQRSMLSVMMDEHMRSTIPRRDLVFASHFQECLEVAEIAPRQFSIRGIRNMVSRLFAIAWSNVAQGRQPWNSDDDFVRDVDAIFKEIKNVARLC